MKIRNGYNFALLLTERGDVYSWGINKNGQLGIGTIDDDYHNPTKIDFILGIPIRYISAGYDYAAAIDFEYNVYVWGTNRGQLGLVDNKNKTRPTLIENLAEKKIQKIYCCLNNIIALTDNGEVYFWGYNYSEDTPLWMPQNIHANSNIDADHNIYICLPTRLNFPDNAVIIKLYIGVCHMFAIDTCSKIYSWGDNNYNQSCNHDTKYKSLPVMTNMLDNFNVKKIICLMTSTIILADNKLYSIGYNEYREVGLSFLKIRKLEQMKMGGKVEKIWGKKETVFCKMCNGVLYARGKNNGGHLGIGDLTDINTPRRIDITPDIKSIKFDFFTTYAITNNGEIYTWGINELIDKNPILIPTPFTYFTDNGIEIKNPSNTKSARKIY